jgi:hypothetical protein
MATLSEGHKSQLYWVLGSFMRIHSHDTPGWEMGNVPAKVTSPYNNWFMCIRVCETPGLRGTPIHLHRIDIGYVTAGI